MKTKQINLYSYDELSEKGKEKALNDYRENNQMDFLSDNMEQCLYNELEENKISYDKTLRVYYSLSYSQGDGFCFIGDFKFKDINIKITHQGRYYHENSTNLIFYDNDGNEIENNITKEFEILYNNICIKMKKIGYDIIEEENSESYIRDYFNSNDYTFRDNGEIENE